MTNKKLKSSNIQYGMMKRDVVNANGKVLLTGLCCLRRQGLGVERLVELFESYAYGTVKQWRQNYDDNTFDRMFLRELERIQITFKDVEPAVKKLIGKLPVGSTWHTFTTELTMFLSHINRYLGYGKVRLTRLLEQMMNYEGDYLAELKEMGITFKGFNEYIFTEKEERKRKITDEELYRLRRGREALRLLQGGVINDG